MFSKIRMMALPILLVTLLAACNPSTTGSGTIEPDASGTPEVAQPTVEADESDAIVAAAVSFLAGELNVPESEITVVSAEETEFSDSCLGLGGPAESCLQAITPGWIIMLDVAGQSYQVHTDDTGRQVRVASELPEGDGAADLPSAAAQEFLSAQLGVALGDVQVVSAEMTQFSDGCLGLGRPDEGCIEVITPGWIIMVDVAGQSYEVHTDATGRQVRVASELPEGDGAANLPSAAAQEFLAAQLGVALGDVQVVSAEMVEFSDGCLGLGRPDESCLQVITPGWIIMLDVAGQSYEVHTDETGQQVRVADNSL